MKDLMFVIFNGWYRESGILSFIIGKQHEENVVKTNDMK